MHDGRIKATSREKIALQFLRGISPHRDSVTFHYGCEQGHLLNLLTDSYWIETWGKVTREAFITFVKEPYDLYYRVEKKEKDYLFKLFLKNENTGELLPVNDQFSLLTSGHVYFYYDQKILHARQKVFARHILPFCQNTNGLIIPEQEFKSFLNQVYPQLISKEAVVELPDEVNITTVENLAGRALYLSEVNGTLQIEVYFTYSDSDSTIPPVKVNAFPFKSKEIKEAEDQYFLIHRQEKLERFYLQILEEHDLQKSVNNYILPAKIDPLNWMFEVLPELAKKGFEIFGEDKLDQLKVKRVTPRVISQVTSGQDWFDLKLEIDFDGLRMSYAEVLRQLEKNNRKFIRLSDGSAVRINEKILEKLGLLRHFALKSDSDGRVRLPRTQALLIDEILKASDTAKTDSDFKKQLKKFEKFKNIKSVKIPEQFQGQLRPYQKAGLDWLMFLSEYGFGGCLADDMGLGKTVQALAMLQLHKEKRRKNLVSLIVAPTSVITNWQREAQKFTPQLKVYVYAGPERIKEVKHFKKFDLIITSYGLLWRDYDFLKEIPFYYVILDESQKIKNPLSVTARSAYHLQARHRLVMTGTPIENNLTELWAQFQFINPGMLGRLKAFNEYFVSGIEKQGDEMRANQLKRMIYPFILRRTKELVVKELPPKVENVVYCEMDESQTKVYNRWRDYYRALILTAIDEQGLNRSKMKVLEGLTRLRQLAIHPAMVEADYRKTSGKFEALMELLEEVIEEKHKVLLFSQFVKALSLVKKNLNDRQVPYLYLDGRTRKRQELIDRFQNDDQVQVFLISLKAGGLGLNLTAADYVVHLDPWWNPAVEAQANDRAHRIGQKKNVFVYKLISKGSVEEKILELQKKKKGLAEKLITTDTAFFKSLQKEDIVQLFS